MFTSKEKGGSQVGSSSSTSSSNTSAPISSADQIPSIVSADLQIVGNLISTGAIEIEGNVEGNVSCKQVTIRRTGSVKGDVSADDIQIDGEVNGLVKGNSINISDTGRVTGMIVYESLSVKDGAFIDGQCKSADNISTSAVEKLEIDHHEDEQVLNSIDVEETETVAATN